MAGFGTPLAIVLERGFPLFLTYGLESVAFSLAREILNRA